MDIDKRLMKLRKNMRRRARKRQAIIAKANASLIESNNSFETSATDYSQPVATIADSIPCSPVPMCSEGIQGDPRFYSSFPPVNEIGSTNLSTWDGTACNNEIDLEDNLLLPQDETSWKPTGDLLKSEEQYIQDMNILLNYNYEDSRDNERDNFLDALRRLNNEYIQKLLKEREDLNSLGNTKKLAEIHDFIVKRLNSMITLFRLANGAIGVSKIQQDALCSSEKALEQIKSQLTSCNGDGPSVSPPREVPSSIYDLEQALDEAKNENYELHVRLSISQMDSVMAEKKLKDQMDAKLKGLGNKLSEIRKILVEKSRCNELIKESFKDRVTAEEIIFDINLLIKDFVQFKDRKCDKETNIVHSSKDLKVTEYEVHLVTMLASFLKTISFAVDLDFICSYVEKVDNALSKQYIESLLKKYPTFFQEESVGAGKKKKWRYLEMKPVITI